VTTEEQDGIDFEARALCADGSCTGVLGDDGRCKVCGLAPGEAPRAASSDAPDEPADAAFDDRALCPDGACIGLIGDDGRCKVCGAAAARS
jgi:hypothetical protein